MSFDLKAWGGQITTGIGALVGTPAVLGLLTHQLTPEQAIPLIAGSIVGLIWPENKQLASATTATATDVEAMIPLLLTAYGTGLRHASSITAPAPVAATNGVTDHA